MQLATVRTEGRTHAAIIDDGRAGLLPQPDVGSLLGEGVGMLDPFRWVPTYGLTFGPLISRPSKIVCVGLNYRGHIAEMGRELPSYPTLFAKFARALIGPTDPITIPGSSSSLDWEGELAFVVGAPLRRADPTAAATAIAGFTVMNDVSERDWQWRTTQWLQGKTFEGTTPLGPVLVTTDEVGPAPDLRLRCWVNDELVQESNTGDLVFDPPSLASYISEIVTLDPGDVIATGTPAGVGASHDPPRFLAHGDTVRTRIDRIGELVNECIVAVGNEAAY